MIRDTSDERLKSLKEDLQRARAEQERHQTLRKTETDAETQAREEAAERRHEDTMSQLRAMRELLEEQRESQAKQVEEMEQRDAERVQRHETTLGQISGLQAAVTSLRDERRAHSEQLAEKHAHAKADAEAIKKVTESVAETREQLLSMADELREDSTRHHEELRHILLANASARESLSSSDFA
ncbi:hypothetical protein BC827DRAFT_1222384 [Russula dissimulans]|nr:hypothetical protein BC827DRAFT_1222384 [Russula dissimulans]